MLGNFELQPYNSMEEYREENGFVGDCIEPMEEASKGLSLSSKTETLGGADANTVDVLGLGVCHVIGNDEIPNDGSSATEDDNTDYSVSDDKQVKADVTEEETKDNVENIIRSDDVERTDAITEPETKRDYMESDGDAGTVEVKLVDEREGSEFCKDVHGVSVTVQLVEVEMKDELAMSEIKSGASHESAGEEEYVTLAGKEVTDEKEKHNVQNEKFQQSSVYGEMLSVGENKSDREKGSTKKSEEDNKKRGVDSEKENEEKVSVSYNEQGKSGREISDADPEKESAHESEKNNNKIDVVSKQANEKYVHLNEDKNPSSKHLEAVQVPEEPTQLSKGETNEGNLGMVSEVSSAAEICHEDEITNVDQKEENGEAMEIDYTAEEQVEMDVTVGGVVQSHVSLTEADRSDSNVVHEMEIDERKDNGDMASDLTGTVESADSSNPNSPTEDTVTGEVEPLDHNALFDPSSDITNFIDFSGVSSWSGNIQDIKIETRNISLNKDKKATEITEEIAMVDCTATLKSVDSTVNAESHHKLTSSAEGIENESNEAHAAFRTEGNQEGKDYQCLDKKTADQQDILRDEDGITDYEMEENPNNSDYADDGTGSDIKTNGVKRKAEVLSEDLLEEGRKTVSLAKVSFVQRPSFKIGACIARAASQMAGSPSILKSSNFGDENHETLSVESFVSQLHCAATDPVKENLVSDIAAGFFLDYRNSSVSQQVTSEKVNSKRGTTSNYNAGGTEAFEFEEMGDTYWTNKVVHYGGEEQTPPTEKENYQVLPVELKPAQIRRTRRPYRKRQSQINTPLSASTKPDNYDENAPAELIMNFSESDTIPPEKSLSKMLKHFGPIQESQTEVDKENNRARVVFRKAADAEVAYNSAGRFNIFGTKTVNYELRYTITETFKVQPYVVCLGEEESALYLPS